jgi:hypothetical protein
MAEAYTEQGGQRLGDDDWIREQSAGGLVLFTKDGRIRKDHLEAVVEASAKIFMLPDRSMNAAAQLQRFEYHKFRIAMAAAKPGPTGYLLQPQALEKWL